MAMKNFVFERENTYPSNQPNLHKLGTGHYLCRGGERKKGGGSRLFQIGYRGGGAKLFIKRFRGGSSLIARCILRGGHWPRWVKQLNSRAQTIYVKQ